MTSEPKPSREHVGRIFRELASSSGRQSHSRLDRPSAGVQFPPRTGLSTLPNPYNAAGCMNAFQKVTFTGKESSWRQISGDQPAQSSATSSEKELRRLTVDLLRVLMASLAMEHGRAALPLSRRLVNACARSLQPDKLPVLKELLRRYLFSSDERLAVEEIEREAVSSRDDAFLAQPFSSAGAPHGYAIPMKADANSSRSQFESRLECRHIAKHNQGR